MRLRITLPTIPQRVRTGARLPESALDVWLLKVKDMQPSVTCRHADDTASLQLCHQRVVVDGDVGSDPPWQLLQDSAHAFLLHDAAGVVLDRLPFAFVQLLEEGKALGVPV